MPTEHVISDEAMQCIETALANNRCWFAYNTISYFLQQEDVYGFKHADQAYEFAALNISHYKYYEVIYASSLADVFRQIHYGQNLKQNLIRSTLKHETMDKENVQYLKDQLKYMGFGEKLYHELDKQLQAGAKEFQLQYKKDDGDLEATLNFRKSDKDERVFFNSYTAKLTTANGEERQHVFYLNKGKGVTLREAENLLSGRSVYKELISKENQPYKAWMQLNLEAPKENGNYKVNHYHDGYGYDLGKALQKLPLQHGNEEAKEKLMKNLQKGNIAMVTFNENGKERKAHLEASPQYKNIVVYNQEMKREYQQHKEQKQESQQEHKRDYSRSISR